MIHHLARYSLIRVAAVVVLQALVGGRLCAADEATLARFRSEYPRAAAAWRQDLECVQSVGTERRSGRPDRRFRAVRSGSNLLVTTVDVATGLDGQVNAVEHVQCWTPAYAFELEKPASDTAYVMRSAVSAAEAPAELTRQEFARIFHEVAILSPVTLFDMPLDPLLSDPECRFIGAETARQAGREEVTISFELTGSRHWYAKGSATLAPDRQWALLGYELTHKPRTPGELSTDVVRISYGEFSGHTYPAEVIVRRKTVESGDVYEQVWTTRFTSMTRACDPDMFRPSYFGLPDLPKFEPRSAGSWPLSLVVVGATLLATSGACRWAIRTRSADGRAR